MHQTDSRIALFLPSLSGGGAERICVNLAGEFARRGFSVDLVLGKAEGPYLAEVPANVRLVDLKAPRVLATLPKLIGYLRRERPTALLSALDHVNVITVWAKCLCRASTRVVVRVANTLSCSSQNACGMKDRIMPRLVRRFYPWADGIIAVSKGVAEDLANTAGLPLDKVRVIYNPVVTPEMMEQAREPVEHPWFASGQPPVILGAGRLCGQKDFPTLIKAFAIIRCTRPARLVILGEGEQRAKLESIVRKLGLENDVSIPGFVNNPFCYMGKSSVFVLSSCWEGLPNVLIQAMASGCPVVSTDCPSGPSEILDNGRYGPLIPVGNVKALARSIVDILDTQREVGPLVSRAMEFTLERAADQYLEVLLQRT